MKVLKKKKLYSLLEKVDELISKADEFETRYSDEIENVHPEYRKSAVNLVHYMAIMGEDLKELEDDLADMSIMPSLKASAHIIFSLYAIRKIINKLLNNKTLPDIQPIVTRKKSRKIIKRHKKALLGRKIKGSKTRIMVTLPTDAANFKEIIPGLVDAGMSAARINCAHDDTLIWKNMIDRINSVKKRTGRNIKISMDLAGPKLRTGQMQPGPKIIHLQPERNSYGNVVNSARVFLVETTKESLYDEIPQLPVSENLHKQLKLNDEIHFIDTRGKKRKLIVDKIDNKKIEAKCLDSAYLITGTELKITNDELTLSGTVGDIPPIEESIVLKISDTLLIYKENIEGKPAVYNESGILEQTARISSTLPEIFNDVAENEIIVFDDGKIEGIIKEINEDVLTIEITHAKEKGSKLRGDKGINLPDSNLSIRGLTEKDKTDLNFILEHSDIVNMSFVNDTWDVKELHKIIEDSGRVNIGVIYKIETKKGVFNLPKILLTAMQQYPFGIMIARGDLAIEIGWKNLGKTQEEILKICNAAHIPIVWATQVLETMAKKGRPSRAEITDANMAERADCVMLNKGPYINETIRTLEEILTIAEKR